eukprot:s436_g46.t1
MCCDDTKSCSHYCPFGPGCQKCAELDKCVVPSTAIEISPTETPGSDEASLAETVPDTPEPEKWIETIPDTPEPEKWIDYLRIPMDLGKAFQNDSRLDVMWEIHRAQVRMGKAGDRFSEFMDWLHTTYDDVPEDFVWGLPENDPLEDLKDFFMFVVENGYGFYEESTEEIPGDNPMVDEHMCEPSEEPVMQ